MLTTLVITLLIFGFIGYKLSSVQNRQKPEIPVKLDLMFFNKEGLKCIDGAVINGNILIRGTSSVEYDFSNLKQSFFEEIYSMASTKKSDWFFSDLQEFKKLLFSFGESCYGLSIQEIEVKTLELGEVFFYSSDSNNKPDDQFEEQVRAEVQARIEEIDSEHEKVLQKHEAEKNAEMQRVQDEVNRAMQIAEEEMNKALEENDRYLQEALKREEEINKKNLKN